MRGRGPVSGWRAGGVWGAPQSGAERGGAGPVSVPATGSGAEDAGDRDRMLRVWGLAIAFKLWLRLARGEHSADCMPGRSEERGTMGAPDGKSGQEHAEAVGRMDSGDLSKEANKLKNVDFNVNITMYVVLACTIAASGGVLFGAPRLYSGRAAI